MLIWIFSILLATAHAEPSCNLFAANDNPQPKAARTVEVLTYTPGQPHSFARNRGRIEGAYRILLVSKDVRELVFDLSRLPAEQRTKFTFRLDLTKPVRVRYTPDANPGEVLFDRNSVDEFFQWFWDPSRFNFQATRVLVYVAENGRRTGDLPAQVETVQTNVTELLEEPSEAYLVQRWATVYVSPEGLVEWESLKNDPPEKAGHQEFIVKFETTRRSVR